MSDLFALWWTSGDTTGPGADLALKSPLAANARQAFDAGRAAECDRIRDALWELHVDATTHGGWMPGWHKFAEMLDGE